MTTQPSFLFVHSYYPRFLEALYRQEPMLASMVFESQRRRIFDTFFGVSDAYSNGLRSLGVEAREVIADADILQARWALEHGIHPDGNIHDQRRQIVAAQVAHYRPDVLYVFEWNPLGDRFVEEMRAQVAMTVGQIASPLPANRTFRGYDLMISSYPPVVEHFRREGGVGELLRLAFDDRVPLKIPQVESQHDVTFVGGFAPSHPDRIAWLERLAAKIELDVFGYGAEQIPAGSPLRARHHGEAWGLAMYQVLQQSRITLNRHAYIDVRGTVEHRYANNMRLYEATGVGTCLVTEDHENLSEMFDPGREVVAYASDAECVEKMRNLLKNAEARSQIAAAGQRRTLRDHTYRRRMQELLGIVTRYLQRRARDANRATL